MGSAFKKLHSKEAIANASEHKHLSKVDTDASREQSENLLNTLPGAPASQHHNTLSDLGPSDLENWAKIGEGAHGDVYSATRLQTGDVVAVKRIPKHLADDYVRSKYTSLSVCNHSNIIAYKQVRQFFLCLLPHNFFPPSGPHFFLL
jgi:hypothetical protein